VIAKVTRDRYMRRADGTYPGWDFAGNVGYSTPEHRAAILDRGISSLHRRSFQSIAYSQLGLEQSEGIAEVVVIDETAVAGEGDPDDVEADGVPAGERRAIAEPRDREAA
jgi:Ribonuclease HII